jgi:hypothetical protein
MTDVRTHRHHRNRLLFAVALFVYLALLAAWQIDALRAAPLEAWGVLTLGGILGAMTATGFVVRNRWRLYLASRP